MPPFVKEDDEIYINRGQIPSHESSLGNELKYSLNSLMYAFLQLSLSWLPEQIKNWPQPAAVIQKEKEDKRCMKIPIRTTVQQMQTAVQGDGTGLQGLGHSATDMESSAMSLTLQRVLSSNASIQTPPLTHWQDNRRPVALVSMGMGFFLRLWVLIFSSPS